MLICSIVLITLLYGKVIQFYDIYICIYTHSSFNIVFTLWFIVGCQYSSLCIQISCLQWDILCKIFLPQVFKCQ